MQTQTYTLEGEECTVHFVEHPDDLPAFYAWRERNGRRVLGFDTETTGLDVFQGDHRLRLVQFGTETEAWVLWVERDLSIFMAAVCTLTRHRGGFVGHNTTYDCLVADRHLKVRLEDLMPRCIDTRILSHLLDPRTKGEGGVGLRLKEMSYVYVDPTAPDTEEGLTAVFRALGHTKATGWANIPGDHPTYWLYAGLDVLLVTRLLREIEPRVTALGCAALAEAEHELALVLALLVRKGMKLDVEYTTRLRDGLREEGDKWRAVAHRLGLESVSSPKQVATRLKELGAHLTERTDTGAFKVDRAVLLEIAGLDRQWEKIPTNAPADAALLAEAVSRAKRADKWGVAYAEALLDLRDPADRIHPVLGGLSARTARMSVSRPPLQQLPSSDWTIRRAFVADDGWAIGGIDYKAVEMRVLAALAGVRHMIEGIKAGEDIHKFTAKLVVGELWASLDDATRAKHRKLYKGVGFGKVYGGGATTLARQTGGEIEGVRAAIRAYDEVYPEIRAYGRKLQRRAEYGAREVVTPTGRHLPLDRDRLYSATNYVVQSTARDLLAEALLRIHKAGLLDYVLLPVHDELIVQGPKAEIQDIVVHIGGLMNTTFMGVPIESDPEVYGASWGHGYGATV